MKKTKILFLVALFMPFAFMAKGGDDLKNKPTPQVNLTAGCAPASSIIFLEFNNVRALVEAGALLFQDRANGVASYEVPIGSNSHVIYASGLWMAGTDENGQLKAAVSKFGQGVDFWTGILDTTGTAEVNDSVCAAFDRFFELTRAEVAIFNAYSQAVANGTAAVDFPGYQIPTAILEWPGNGDVTKGQDFRIAPYVNVGGDESYEPNQGDYPFYDLVGDVDCRADRADRSISGARPLFGDKTYWYVFNDKGNLHTESNAPSIGMEIHAQAFAFATNDEINDMTFYNYELINRSTFTLTNTYFASYVDPDVGAAADDFVGCDVARGLGYAFNGSGAENDPGQGGQVGYGANPPAVGIDFFEGPYQDADGINNLVGIGPGEALNGLGYYDPTDSANADLVVDNERFGMRRFVYYNIGNASNGDPTLAVHYYNYMRGIWKNGTRMRHGGNGFNSAAVENVETDFMFPGTSDPLHWGTTDENGITTIPTNLDWTEDNPGAGQTANQAGDRRFLQSAGPFTLEPGNVNDITVGVVFAQATSGGRLASVADLFVADDKAQALFDNCFQVLNGPDAPDVTVQELDRELVFYLSNPETSNNFGENYEETDPDIVTPDSLINQGIVFDDKYRFQGYQVFQLAGPGISVSDIEDPDKARLVFQCDVRDGVTDLINFTFDKDLNANIPVQKVTGADEGIQRSFSVNEDLFATDAAELVNFKTYYYIAIAYGYNEFKPYLQDGVPNPAQPLAPASDGQTSPYISSRRSGTGGSVTAFTAIPHDPTVESGGTVINSSYGDEIGVTRLQGAGNGGNALTITQESIDNILATKAWEDTVTNIGAIDYVVGEGPFQVSVIDPLNVVDGTFYLQFTEDTIGNSYNWKLWLSGSTDTAYSEKTLAFYNQQLLLDPNWGLSITIEDGIAPGGRAEGTTNGFISAELTYADELQNQWLSGIPDSDFEGPTNWILAGTAQQGNAAFFDYTYGPDDYIDPDQDYEQILGGVIAPYALTRYELSSGASEAVNAPASSNIDVEIADLSKLSSIQLVITSDQTKWTRCPVIETKDDGVAGSHLKNMVKLNKLSVDKNGDAVDTTGFGRLTNDQIDSALTSTDENNAGFISAFGMGWFPGYVIEKETGKRLNMAFGEDSRYSLNNGNDMIWNPTSTFADGVFPNINNVWGGKHFIYIFREIQPEGEDARYYAPVFNDPTVPAYDYGAKLRELLSEQGGTLQNFRRALGWAACNWVALPFLAFGEEVLSNDVQIDVNVNAQFSVQPSTIVEDPSLDNAGKGVYRFNTVGKGTQKAQTAVLSDALEGVNVVPNPYYSLSDYELTQLENTVKFTNLPENCNITIYNTNGTLIRRYFKSSPENYLDWDLNNQVGIPISSGVYIIHVEVPNVGEKILKWFGVVRPVDLNNF